MNDKTDNRESHICCICGKRFFGYGNNPYPIIKNADARCCNGCNETAVIPERIARMNRDYGYLIN